jgi:hypothetical protein
MNDFSMLFAESAESHFAQVASNEPHNADESHGWPGDGSGEDDLADLMAHGDEGCCDDSEDSVLTNESEDAYLDATFENCFDSGD